MSNADRHPLLLIVCLWLVATMGGIYTSSPMMGQTPTGEYLSPSEIDEIREAQDINERVPLYLKFAQARLLAAQKLLGIAPPTGAKESGKKKSAPEVPLPPDIKPEKPKSLPQLLSEYDRIYTEMMKHMDERLDAGADARQALKEILKESPLNQNFLKAIAEKLGEDAPDELSAAQQDTEEAIDGAQSTLPGLEEKFKQEKKQKKQKNRDKGDSDIL